MKLEMQQKINQTDLSNEETQVMVTGGYVMTQVRHVAYQLICLGEETIEPSLYLYSIKSYRQKPYLTSYDLERPEEEATRVKTTHGSSRVS